MHSAETPYPETLPDTPQPGQAVSTAERDRALFDLLRRAEGLDPEQRAAVLTEAPPTLAAQVAEILDQEEADDGFMQTGVFERVAPHLETGGWSLEAFAEAAQAGEGIEDVGADSSRSWLGGLSELYRRHRRTGVAAVLTLCLLVAGLVVLSMALLEARTEAAAARQAQADSEHLVEELVRSLARSGASEGSHPASQMTALELVQRATASLEHLEDPAVRIRLEGILQDLQRQIGSQQPRRGHETSRQLGAVSVHGDPVLAASHVKLAKDDLKKADYVACRRHIEAAFDTLNGHQSPAARRTRADIFDVQGRLELRLGNFDAAASSLRRAISIYRELGEEKLAGGSLGHLGATYYAQKRWAEAERINRQALALLERHYAPGHSLRLDAKNNLAASMARQGRLSEAASLFEDVTAKLENTSGDDPVLLANTLNHLGMLHLDLGQAKKSEAFHRQALEIRQGLFGHSHPKVAWSLDSLSQALDALGESAQAFELQSQALRIREAAFGPRHLDVARSHIHLAELAHRRGEFSRALRLGEKALETHRLQLAAGHAVIGSDLVQIGRSLSALGRRDEARARFQEAVAIFQAGGTPVAKELEETRRYLEEPGAGS